MKLSLKTHATILSAFHIAYKASKKLPAKRKKIEQEALATAGKELQAFISKQK